MGTVFPISQGKTTSQRELRLLRGPGGLLEHHKKYHGWEGRIRPELRFGVKDGSLAQIEQCRFFGARVEIASIRRFEIIGGLLDAAKVPVADVAAIRLEQAFGKPEDAYVMPWAVPEGAYLNGVYWDQYGDRIIVLKNNGEYRFTGTNVVEAGRILPELEAYLPPFIFNHAQDRVVNVHVSEKCRARVARSGNMFAFDFYFPNLFLYPYHGREVSPIVREMAQELSKVLRHAYGITGIISRSAASVDDEVIDEVIIDIPKAA